GTQRYSTPGLGGTVEVRGGDGGFTFIDQTQDNIAISSYVRNTYNRSTNGGLTFPTVLINDGTGSFINPADYDDVEDILYSYRTASSLYRVLNVSGTFSVGQITGGFGGTVTHLRVSPYSSAGTSTLFIGTASGRMFRIDNAESTADVTEIDGPFIGAVSSIDFGASEDQILLTVSNYGVNSVWESLDGGDTWTNKEGDLPDMPVRWAMYNPLSRNAVLLATEAGVWETPNFDTASPNWTIAPGFPVVRTDMLQLRESDQTVMATTHGRGVFTSTFRSVVVSNEDRPTAAVPETHVLGSAYPNPFNPQTQFTLSVAEPQRVQITLLDSRGRRIRVLQDETMASSAQHTVTVDGANLASGLYLVAIEGEKFRDQLRVTLVK
ncbi:MAG: T9SS type A sorting domain-containing protein, partial [Rubricoccaceae bacterium]|nr:T9SS type A sorting domain-containing protein [Rubricoccaceae bacterium]